MRIPTLNRIFDAVHMYDPITKVDSIRFSGKEISHKNKPAPRKQSMVSISI